MNDIDLDILNQTMPTPSESAAMKLARMALDPNSEFNHHKRMYGSVFVQIDHETDTVTVLEPERVMIKPATQTVERFPDEVAYTVTGRYPSRLDYQSLPRTGLVEKIMRETQRVMLVDGEQVHFERMLRAFREYPMPVPEWPELRQHRGHELTWECRGAELLEQRERALLRRHHEARSRQAYQARCTLQRHQKRTRSPRGAGFQS